MRCRIFLRVSWRITSLLSRSQMDFSTYITHLHTQIDASLTITDGFLNIHHPPTHTDRRLAHNTDVCKARFPSKRNRLRWKAANHGCHCFDGASYWLPIGCSVEAVATMIGCIPTQALAFSAVSIQTQQTRLSLDGNRALAIYRESMWTATHVLLPSQSQCQVFHFPRSSLVLINSLTSQVLLLHGW